MKGYLKGGLFIFLYLFCAISCKKSFLDKIPKSDPVQEVFINGLESCEEYLYGIYASFSYLVCSNYNLIYPEVVSDNVKPVQSALFAQYSLTQKATDEVTTSYSSNMNGLWTSCYRVVRDCNYLLENVDRFRDTNSQLADHIKGQAYAMRAIVYHDLLNVFSQPYQFTSDASHLGVPMVSNSDFTIPIGSRLTVFQNYEHIIEDLGSAIQLINPSVTNRTIINRNAAKAFLSRVYLFKRDFKRSLELAKEVIHDVPIMIESYPKKLFTSEDSEALFQLPPSEKGYTTDFPGSSFYESWSLQFVATKDIADILSEYQADVRKEWVRFSSGRYIIQKFPVSVVSDVTNPGGSYYQTLIRSSELYLTIAECYAKLPGKRDSAIRYLDAIRFRAIANAPITTAVDRALVDSILKERRRELCFEGLRLFDLLREGRNIERSDVVSPAPKQILYPNSRLISPIHLLDVNQLGIIQNPSY